MHDQTKAWQSLKKVP